jgi:beta-xylosidase
MFLTLQLIWQARRNPNAGHGGVNELGLDMDDDRSLWKKMTEPYVPEVDEVEILERLRQKRPEWFASRGPLR